LDDQWRRYNEELYELDDDSCLSVYVKYLSYQGKHFKGQFSGIRPIEELRKRWENGVWFDAAIFMRIQHY
jgi:hypothetical protein